MEVHKITLYVVDHDRMGLDAVCDTLVNARYPNHCISPEIISSASADAGEWGDDHPLNNTDACQAEISRLFG